MKKMITVLLLLSQIIVFSQEEYAWVYFGDKPNQQTFLDNPLTMLTQRALDRRTRQNIALDTKDVPVYQSYIDQIKAAPGISVQAKSKWLNALLVYGRQRAINKLKVLPFVARIDFADKILNSAKIENDEPEPVIKKTAARADFLYGGSVTQIQMLNGHLLHQQNYTGTGKIIAVLGSGFEGTNTISPFARIRNNNQILGGYNFANRDNNFYSGNDHGTKVLSTMAAYQEGQLVGTAPDASYYLFRVSRPNTPSLNESLWVEAAEMADSLGVDIINLSDGIGRSVTNINYNYTYQDMNGNTTFAARGFNIAFSRGMVLVASAGDTGGLLIWRYVISPADAANVLAVGAVTGQGYRLLFSAFGPSSDGRIKPDIMAMGNEVKTANKNGDILNASGTAYSSSIIAGLAACLWQALPDKTNAEILQLIKESANRYTHPTNSYGYGIPDFQRALENGTQATMAFTSDRPALYPNPTDGLLTITGLNDKTAKIRFTNTMGRKVLEQQLTGVKEATISVENLKPGIYLYAITSGNGTFSGKIVKK